MSNHGTGNKPSQTALNQMAPKLFNIEFYKLQLEINKYWRDSLAEQRYAKGKRLLRHGFKVYSQSDEDGIIEEIFKRIGTDSRTFVEFGVQRGVECNTTKLLLEGWRGLWLEGSADHVSAIEKTFRGLIEAERLKCANAYVTRENINSLLSDNGMAGDIDLLSIDIDGNDYWVWEGIEAIRPRVVVIEYNATLRPPLSVVVPYRPDWRWDGSNYFGCSLCALCKLGEEKGYNLVGCGFSGANAFFVRADLCGNKFHAPFTAEEHYEPPRYFFSTLSGGDRPGFGPFEAV